MALFFSSNSNKKKCSTSTKTQQQKREQRKRKHLQMAAEAKQHKSKKKKQKSEKQRREDREIEVGVFEPALPNWPNEVQKYIEQQLKKYDYFKKRPHVYPVPDFDSFLKTIIALLEKKQGDFCWSMDWQPAFFSTLIYHGFLCIASKIQDDLWVMLPKLHEERCIVDLDPNSNTNHLPLPVSKSTKKKSKKYSITIDQCYERVFQGCIDQHGLNWLYPPMQGVLYRIYQKRGDPKFHGVTSHSIEVWDEDGKLVAGELGTSVGCIYTSLTGFYLESGTGSIQLLALSHLLQKCKFKLWDLGMFIEYKSSLGAGVLPRKEFLAKYRALRDLKTASLVCAEKTNCRDLVNEVINSVQSRNDANQEEKKEDDADVKMQNNDNDNKGSGDAPKQMSRKEQKRLAKLERRKLAKQRAKAEREKQQKQSQDTNKPADVEPDNGDTDDTKDVNINKTGQ